MEDGAGFAGFAAGEIGQLPSDPDIAAMPDLDSFTLVPWQENLARFACDVTVEGEAWPYCPRTILRNVLAKAAEQGYEFKIGIELEYFLVQLNADGTIEIADKLDTLEKPCYDMAGLTRQYDFLTTVSRYCNELGWGNYANDHEDANGQFEQNFEYADALTSCDRAIFFRYMVHTLAEQHGRVATFMPKPFTNLTGNGCHFHLSLWKDGENVFLDESDPRARPVHGRPTASSAASRPTPAPPARSRRRPSTPTSGSSPARPRAARPGRRSGSRTATTTAPRCCGSRPPDGSRTGRSTAPATRISRPRRCSPRASTASRTASRPASRTPRTSTSFSYDELTARASGRCPQTCSMRSASSSSDDVLRAALGRGRDEDYVDYYVRVKRDEWFRYHEQVSAWEVREYLTRF